MLIFKFVFKKEKEIFHYSNYLIKYYKANESASIPTSMELNHVRCLKRFVSMEGWAYHTLFIMQPD